jgi:hypothetical protein
MTLNNILYLEVQQRYKKREIINKLKESKRKDNELTVDIEYTTGIKKPLKKGVLYQ